MHPIAISTGPDTHLDHLGVLCALLEIPLIVTDPDIYDLGKKFYPKLDIFLKDPLEVSLPFLADHDLIFGCGKFWALELLPLFELFQNKKMRLVFCPHGNSDKGHSLNASHLSQDIALVYGRHMIDLLKKTKSWKNTQRIVRTGNYRYPFYRQHKKFYDSCAQELLGPKNKKTILYAPTWKDRENPSSFFEDCSLIIDQLAGDFNILLKPHPLLEQQEPVHFHRIVEHYQGHKDVALITSFPPIYPLLARADIYLGDFSSIGYDFLAFDRPLFFLNSSQNKLHQCGMTIPPKEKRNLRAFLKSNLCCDFSKERQKTYAYAFGKERKIGEIKKELFCPTAKIGQKREKY